MGADDLRIVHMASLARSGETLLVRTLAAHSQVHVVHDLFDTNSADETRLFQLLRVWPDNRLPRRQVEQHLAPGRIGADCRVLLVKQGVFAPRHAFDGFGLLRNPYAVFCSLWSYDARLAHEDPSEALNRRYWAQRRLPRLQAWVQATMPWALDELRAEPCPVKQFLRFWQERVRQIVDACPCIVRYEDFVQAPAAELARICAALALPFDPAMTQAHTRYAPGQRGHGGIDLGAPIRATAPWAPDPLVDIEPFVEAVQRAAYRGYASLYDVQPDGMHCHADGTRQTPGTPQRLAA